MDKTLFSHYAIALLDLAIVKDVVDSTKDEIVSLRDLFKNHKEFIKVLSLKNPQSNKRWNSKYHINKKIDYF